MLKILEKTQKWYQRYHQIVKSLQKLHIYINEDFKQLDHKTSHPQSESEIIVGFDLV